MFPVLLQAAAVGQDVIKVGGTEDVKEGSKHIIDKVLEACWDIGEAKRHDKGLIELIPGMKCCLLLFPLCHPDQVVSSIQI